MGGALPSRPQWLGERWSVAQHHITRAAQLRRVPESERIMKEKYQAGTPLPESVGLCADLYSEVRELRLEMQRHTDAVRARETEIREYIIANLSKSDDTGAAGKKYRAQIVTRQQATVRDWDSLWSYIHTHKRFDLLQKRVSDKAVKDMWEAGEAVPGVEKFNSVDVSITKI